MALFTVDSDLNIYPPKPPCDIEVEYGGYIYFISIYSPEDKDNTAIVLYKFEEGDELNAQEVARFEYKRLSWEYATLHLLRDKFIIFFQSRWDHETDSDFPEWQVHYIEVDPNTYNVNAVVNLSGRDFDMTESEGPIKITTVDAPVSSTDLRIYYAFDCNKNIEGREDNFDLAFGCIGDTVINSQLLYTIDYSDELFLYLDYDMYNNKVFLSCNFSQHILYMLYPNVRPEETLLGLDEGRQTNILRASLGFRTEIGFKRSSIADYLSVHNTYYTQVPKDTKDLAMNIIGTDYVVFTYKNDMELYSATFDAVKAKFYPGAIIFNNVLSFNTSREFIPIPNKVARVYVLGEIGLHILTYNVVLDSPTILSPKNMEPYLASKIEHIFKPSPETEGNPLYFQVRLTFDGKTHIFKSDSTENSDKVSWFYSDTEQWVPLPTSGLPAEFQNENVKIVVDRSVFYEI